MDKDDILDYSLKNGWIICKQPECYICLLNEIEEPKKRLYKTSCKCKDLYYHKECLDKFTEINNINYCTICNEKCSEIKIKKKARYSVCELFDIFMN